MFVTSIPPEVMSNADSISNMLCHTECKMKSININKGKGNVCNDIPSGSISSCSSDESSVHGPCDSGYDHWDGLCNDKSKICTTSETAERDDVGVCNSDNDAVENRVLLNIRRRKVRFALSNENDDTSLEMPSCVHYYSNDIVQHEYEYMSFDSLWWSVAEEEQLFQNVKRQCRIIRAEHRETLQSMFQCYDSIGKENPFNNTSTLQCEIRNWLSLSNTSTTRGLEGIVSKKFKRERQQVIQRTLACFEAAKHSQVSLQCRAELVRSYSTKLSYSTCIFAQQLAIADEQDAL